MLKTDPTTSPRTAAHDDNDCADPATDRANVRRRQWLTIIFAIVLVSIAGLAPAAQPLPSIQYDGVTAAGHSPHPQAVVNWDRLDGGAVRHPAEARQRPRYVEMSAYLANFDADADPDGWHADIVLRDGRDRPAPMRAQATFLLTPRVSTLTGHLIDADTDPIRWSQSLEFDPDGVARVKLPLRQSLRPLLGWSDADYPQSGMRSSNDGIGRRGTRNYSRTRSWVTPGLREVVGTPNVGELRVRVSVPTQGVFESVVPVRIRPSLLVDTAWPYR